VIQLAQGVHNRITLQITKLRSVAKAKGNPKEEIKWKKKLLRNTHT